MRSSEVERLDLRVDDLRQLFNSMDASPFRERDLDPDAEEFILSWAREVRTDARLAVAVHTIRAVAGADEVTAMRQAMRDYFAHRAVEARLRLRRLFRTGRWNLLVGVLFVALALIIGDLVSGLVGRYNYGRLIQESIGIGAWVALWRPIEIFLYDWWPIRAEAVLYDRLSGMSVEVINSTKGHDGPAAAG